MSRVRRERLRRALLVMVSRYGASERSFGRWPLESPEGRRAGRAAARRYEAIKRLARSLADEGGAR